MGLFPVHRIITEKIAEIKRQTAKTCLKMSVFEQKKAPFSLTKR